MDHFLDIFRITWEIDIKSKFSAGIITYERQLQSILYNLLRSKLEMEYEIYIEPVIYQLGKIKPDLVITKKNKIISVIELKAKPWEYPNFLSDMKKLERFKRELKANQEIVLGWIPHAVDWYDQDQNENMKLKYFIDKDLQLILAIISKHDSDIITKEFNNYSPYCDIMSYKIFLGFLNKDKKIEFRMK